jgi:hypothetical protein
MLGYTYHMLQSMALEAVLLNLTCGHLRAAAAIVVLGL